MGDFFAEVFNLGAKREYYETAKQVLIFAFENSQVNEQQVMAYNVGESQFDNEKWRAYKNSRAGSSSSSSSSSASPSSSSSGTDDFLRGVIKEEQTLTGGGYSGDVSMHKKYTWVNESGETMQTNDPNYNPNSDTSTYHHNWSLMQNQ